MKSLLNDDGYQEIKQRLGQITEETERLWGKMEVGQMLWHCQYPLKLAIENKKNETKGNWFIRTFFKKSLYSDKAFRKNLPTDPRIKAKESKDFTAELGRLNTLVDEFYGLKEREIWYPHPIFGEFTADQWGRLEYKHLDHHLRQFGV